MILEYKLIPIKVRESVNDYNGMKIHEREQIEIKSVEPFRCLAQ